MFVSWLNFKTNLSWGSLYKELCTTQGRVFSINVTVTMAAFLRLCIDSPGNKPSEEKAHRTASAGSQRVLAKSREERILPLPPVPSPSLCRSSSQPGFLPEPFPVSWVSLQHIHAIPHSVLLPGIPFPSRILLANSLMSFSLISFILKLIDWLIDVIQSSLQE